MTATEPAAPLGGAWAVYYYDMNAVIAAIYPTEIDALRAAVTSGTGHCVAWLPWGTAINDVDDT